MHLYYSTDSEILTECCLRELNEHSQDDPTRRAFLLVPESMKADLEREYLERHNRRGLMMAEVLSFRRLAHRLFSEAGGLAVKRLSPAGKTLLLQEILQKKENSSAEAKEKGQAFSSFPRFVGRPGFISELSSVLGDFSRYNIAAEDLIRASAAAETKIMKEKFSDFSLLLMRYQEALATHELVDPDHDLDRLIDLLEDTNKIARLSFLQDTSIWVLGFGQTRAFTSQELKILELLQKTCKKLTLTVSLDQLELKGAGDRTERSDPVYSHGLDAARQIQGISAGKLELKRFEAEKKEPDIYSVYAVNPREELRFVFGSIRDILHNSDLNRRDIGIALADPDSYYDLLSATAATYDLPIFIDKGSKLTHSSFIRYLDALLEYLLEKPGLDKIVIYLRSCLGIYPKTLIDSFENLCLSKGLITARDFDRFDADEQLKVGLISQQEYLLWQQIKAELKTIDQLGVKIRQKRLGVNKLDLLYQWLILSENIRDILKDRIEQLRSKGETEAALILAKSWNHWLKFRDEAKRILKNLQLSQQDFTRLIRAALTGFRHNSIPIGIDRIRIGDLGQMASFPVQVLFIVGTNQENFPAKSSEEGYLRDSERVLLEDSSQKKFPNRKQDLPLAREWQIRQLLNNARKKLYISTASLSSEERSLLQLEMEEQKGAKKIVLSTPLAFSSVWNSLKSLKRALNLTLSDQSLKEQLEINWLIKLEAILQLDKEIKIGPGTDAEPENLALPPEQVKQLVLPYKTTSVSQLQKYNACPYSYFNSYLLRLQERDVWQPAAREQGSILHALLEISISELIKELGQAKSSAEKGDKTKGWFNALTPDKLRELFELAISTSKLSSFSLPEVRGQMKQRILNYAATTLSLTADQMLRDSSYPVAVEWRFPIKDQANLLLEANDWQLQLKGVIDRIDQGENGFTLIDYKRGQTDISYAEITAGLNIQLPLYMKVYRHLYPEQNPHAFAYFSFKSRRSDNRKSILPAEFDRTALLKESFDSQMLSDSAENLEILSDYSAQRAKETMHAILSGDMGAKPQVIKEGASPCSYCLFKAHCLYDQRNGRDQLKDNLTKAEREMEAKRIIQEWQREDDNQVD